MGKVTLETSQVSTTTQEVKTVMDKSAQQVKASKISLLRGAMKPTTFMGKLQSLPKPMLYAVGGSTGFYLAYKLLAGPQSLTLQKNCTVTKDSGPLSLVTHHLCHTSLPALAFNTFVFTTFGRYHWNAFGAGSLVKLAAAGCIAGSLLVAREASTNANYTAAGANSITGALLAFHAFKTPNLFHQLRFVRLPLAWVALALAYGIQYNDQNVIGGVSAGYLMFLFGLW